jgi:phosphate transport system permease protein
MTAAQRAALFAPRLARRRAVGLAFLAFCIGASVSSVLVLASLIWRIVSQGLTVIDWGFLTSTVSQLNPADSGIYAALIGTVWLMVLTTLIAVPLGVGAAIYLHEYARPTRLTRLIELNIANLAGVPSIVYGLLGLTIFVRLMTRMVEQAGIDQRFNPFGDSLLSGALTMALLVLPVIIIAAREALAAVPDSVRQAAYAVGATRWQAVRSHVLPAALPGIITGMILSLSRAIGEAAPLIVVGAATYMSQAPQVFGTDFTVLPIQVFFWASENAEIFEQLTAGAILVLLVVLFVMNSIGVLIRGLQQRQGVNA